MKADTEIRAAKRVVPKGTVNGWEDMDIRAYRRDSVGALSKRAYGGCVQARMPAHLSRYLKQDFQD